MGNEKKEIKRHAVEPPVNFMFPPAALNMHRERLSVVAPVGADIPQLAVDSFNMCERRGR